MAVLGEDIYAKLAPRYKLLDQQELRQLTENIRRSDSGVELRQSCFCSVANKYLAATRARWRFEDYGQSVLGDKTTNIRSGESPSEVRARKTNSLQAFAHFRLVPASAGPSRISWQPKMPAEALCQIDTRLGGRNNGPNIQIAQVNRTKNLFCRCCVDDLVVLVSRS